MNPEGGFEKISSEQEISPEEEHFMPQIIIDFIRHGQAEYGPEVRKAMEDMGYSFEDILPTSRISEDITNKESALGGRLTDEGKSQLQEATQSLLGTINPSKENIMILFSPKTRTVESANIILGSLEKIGINVSKAREQQDLTDIKGRHWLAVIEAATKAEERPTNPFAYWYQIPDEKLRELDLEGPRDVQKRIDRFITLIQRYANRYRRELNLDEKTLRVIAITHDLGLYAASRHDPESQLKPDQIKNAQILELSIDSKGKESLSLK